ncbi:MAG TPA: hypothetical protein VJT67_08275 [Longimicrobiaceae bacterium]|nr:hypothetical protein [Longimicrobiaceae bacterium]
MSKPSPAKRPGRKKVPSERRFCERIVFRLKPSQFARLTARAAELGLTPNDYARDRAIGRVRPSRALRRLGDESVHPLDDLAQFVEFAHALLPHLESHFDPASEIGTVVRRARRRFTDPAVHLRALRSLIEQAVNP